MSESAAEKSKDGPTRVKCTHSQLIRRRTHRPIISIFLVQWLWLCNAEFVSCDSFWLELFAICERPALFFLVLSAAWNTNVCPFPSTSYVLVFRVCVCVFFVGNLCFNLDFFKKKSIHLLYAFWLQFNLLTSQVSIVCYIHNLMVECCSSMPKFLGSITHTHLINREDFFYLIVFCILYSYHCFSFLFSAFRLWCFFSLWNMASLRSLD